MLCTITSTCHALYIMQQQCYYFLVSESFRTPQPNFLSIRQLALRNARTCMQFNSGVLAETAKLG